MINVVEAAFCVFNSFYRALIAQCDSCGIGAVG